MQNFGEILRSARESRGIDLDRAERETNISRKYLESLESELLTMFPGEAYLTGFLRNYSEYLDLNPEDLIALYRAAKIQESPVPEALLKKTKKKLTPLAVIIISSLVIIFIGGGFAFLYNLYVKSKQAVFTPITRTEIATYALGSTPIQKRLYRGDKIEIPLIDGTITLTVGETLKTLSLLTPAGVQIVELGEEIDLDVDGNHGGEVAVFLSDISNVDESRGAEVQMMLSQGTVVLPNAPPEEDELTVTSVNANRRTVIFEGGTAYPITLNVSFRSQCLFRYEPDRKDRIEKYYSTNDLLSIQANNGIRIWMSNANAAKLQVIGGGKTIDLEVGKPGQVVVQDIKWIKDDDGKFRLVVLAVE